MLVHVNTLRAAPIQVPALAWVLPMHLEDLHVALIQALVLLMHLNNLHVALNQVPALERVLLMKLSRLTYHHVPTLRRILQITLSRPRCSLALLIHRRILQIMVLILYMLALNPEDNSLKLLVLMINNLKDRMLM